MQINAYNFIRWSNNEIDAGLPEPPHAYWFDRNRCGYMPIGVPTEAMTFYINNNPGFDIEPFDTLRLALHRSDGTLVQDGIGPLQHLDLGNGRYHIYCQLVFPLADPGIHYFRIYRNDNTQEICTSSDIMVRTDIENLYKTTTYCKFRHDRFFYNTHYHLIPGFYQQIRLNLSVVDEQIEGEEEIYKEVTTGKPRTLNSYEDKVLKLETYYFDKEAHEAAALMFKHSFLELNQRRVRKKEAYKYSPNPRTKLSKGEASVYDEAFASVNRC